MMITSGDFYKNHKKDVLARIDRFSWNIPGYSSVEVILAVFSAGNHRFCSIFYYFDTNRKHR